MENKILRFAPKSIPHILEKNKYVTYRLKAVSQEYHVGEVVDLQNSETEQVFGKALITGSSTTIFKGFPLNEKRTS